MKAVHHMTLFRNVYISFAIVLYLDKVLISLKFKKELEQLKPRFL